jgi:hypothetical protein
MRLNRGILCFFFLSVLVTAVSAQGAADYKKEIAAWDKKRLESLKSDNGWVNLAGLFWLKPGENRFGSDQSNEVVFRGKGFPAVAGNFIVEEKEVKWVSTNPSLVSIKGNIVTEAIAFHIDSARTPQFSLGSYRWNIIKREDKIGVRFRDLNSAALNVLAHIPRYEADIKWKIKAVFEPTLFKTIPITNVLGQTTQQASPGRIVFEIAGKTYKLDALDEGPGDLFVIFGDGTNGDETYPSGRFIYVSRPDANGKTSIDFNKSENPPCAFTSFATCPLPPRQNILNIRIEAGEKKTH